MSASADATRQYWVATAERLARPVLAGLAERTLHAHMQVESRPGIDRSKVSHLEALGRLLAGLAPWLELYDSASQAFRFPSLSPGETPHRLRSPATRRPLILKPEITA